jgi:hypothetical protein
MPGWNIYLNNMINRVMYMSVCIVYLNELIAAIIVSRSQGSMHAIRDGFPFSSIIINPELL